MIQEASPAGLLADAPGRIRTCDFCLRRAALYPLSYGRPRPESRRCGRPSGRRGVMLRRVVIAVISDTHLPRGARRLPDACVERIAGADLILHAGDLASAEVLHELEAHRAARGRGPRQRGRAPRCGGRCRPTRVVEAGGARIAMVHDAGPRAGRLERLRRRVSRTRGRGGLRPLAPSAARGSRRLPDLQPGQPHRPPPRASPHDGPWRARGRRRAALRAGPPRLTPPGRRSR